MTLLAILTNQIQELFNINADIILTRPAEQFGDYTTNVALQLAGKLSRPPREVAIQLAQALKNELGEQAKNIEVAGPGFINITLSDHSLLRAAQAKPATATPPTEVVIETNNPNPFKAMHIGHAFNAILADTVANLLAVGGAKVHRVSYHGDVGAHVGRSMYSLLKFVDGDIKKLHTIKPQERNTFMSKMYAQGTAAYKNDVQAKQQIDALAQQSFTLDDPLYKEVYETCKAWSFEQIDELVERMGNAPTQKRYLESQADALGVTTVKAHVGNVFVQSNGAIVFPGSKYGSFDNVFVSSNGRGLYGARDLGLIQLKHQDFPKASKSYIVTAEEQRDYFKGVIKAAELALPKLAGVTVNISTGTLKLATGKMSSRSGDVLEVGWLFDQIADAVRQNGDTNVDQAVVGAMRYEFLKVRIGGDVIFDIQEAVSIKGNSGPYLQYAHARARSILAKVHHKGLEPTAGEEGFEPLERSLLRKISEYPDVVEKSATELMPHHICTYLYELAQTFNRFYEHSRVIDDPRQAQRLHLVSLYAETLKKGLAILGIPAPEKL